VNILALDSSTSVASVAFVSVDGSSSDIRFLCNTPHHRSDSSALFTGLQAAVAAGGIPDAVCVGLGPGSYNGLRAGIATARAFATALEIPLHALPSPLALQAPASTFWAIGDARGGHYWIACIQDGTFLEEPRLILPSEITLHFQTRPDLLILASAPLPEIDLLLATPCAAQLAILAKNKDAIAGTPEPLYLKPTHITPSRKLSPGI